MAAEERTVSKYKLEKLASAGMGARALRESERLGGPPVMRLLDADTEMGKRTLASVTELRRTRHARSQGS